ncbi:MAG: hypothetical protein CMI90_06155 [Pelagibacteraceae bacterium]|nr:hypothetical protein [Pelagibacteraceae bacterium]
MINNQINISDLHKNIFTILNDKKINQSSSEANIIISEVAKVKNYKKLSDINFKKLNLIIRERLKGKPLAKIINKKGFWKEIFFTNEFTLDPRADSEVLIESVLEDFSNFKKQKIKFIDLCSGTGCLGISILNEFINSECLFMDICNHALNVNKINCKNLNVINKSTFLKSDLFMNFKNNINDFKFIICNPPYIISEDILKLDKDTSYDPVIALDGGEKGYKFYQLIISQLINMDYKNSIYFEIDPKIKKNVLKLAMDNNLKVLYIKKDYLKLDRLIKISFH